MTAAERIIRLVCRLLPPGLRDWGEAMAQEAAAIERPGAAIAFAVSCGAWVVREALGHALRSSLTPTARDPADFSIQPNPWGSRATALTCAIAATGLGLVYLAEAGEPIQYLTLNLTALIAGLIIVVPFRRHDPVTTPFVGVVAISTGLILLLTAVFGEEASGARRWVSVGNLAVQPSLIGLPFLLVAYARSRHILTTTGLMVGAIALALQPDRAMAGAMVAGIGVAALMKRDRMALSTLSVSLICFIVTMVRPDALPAKPFVDAVFHTASSASLIAGLAVWGGSTALLLPSILGRCRNRDTAAAHAAFGATWLVLILAALFADYPLPMVAYGGSAIVGYVWTILAFPAEGSLAGQPVPAMGSHASMTIERDADRLVHSSQVKSVSP